jgi:hypothetical protein
MSRTSIRPPYAILRAVLTAALLIPPLSASAQPRLLTSEAVTNDTLTVHPGNRRYFMRGNTCEAVYLAGTQHSGNVQDSGSTYPPPAFDFSGTYPPADALKANFIRGWHWEASRSNWGTATDWILPLPFARTGLNPANDGKPRFNLTQYDGSYVTRLQNRANTAASEGMHLSIMLFQGFSVQFPTSANMYNDHPFRSGNNNNGINGDWTADYPAGGEMHSLIAGKPAAVTNAQDNYVRHIVQSLNGAKNILWEVSNESPVSAATGPGSDTIAWQNHIADVIRAQESTLPNRHLVWISAPYGNRVTNVAVYNSAADVVSPSWAMPAVKADGTTISGGVGEKKGIFYQKDPPVTSGKKIVVLDTDHLGAPCDWCDRSWVWKAFTRGYHVMLLEDTSPDYPTNRANARRGINQTVNYSQKIRLIDMAPQSESQSTPCSTRYCLYTSDNPDPQPYAPAVPNGKQYLVFKPDTTTSQVTIFSLPPGDYSGEWLNVQAGSVSALATFTHPGGNLVLASPYGTTPSALWLKRNGVTFICS